MKKNILILMLIIFFSSCSVNSEFNQTLDKEETTNELSEEIKKTTSVQQDFISEKIFLNLNIFKPVEDVKIPFILDLTTNDWVNNAYCMHKHIKWYVEPIGKDTYSFDGSKVAAETLVLKNVSVASSAAEVTATSAAPSLYIGNSELRDYTFSFDFLLADSSMIEFSVYDESLYTDWKCDESQPFWFQLDYDGLVFATAFGKGTYRYETLNSESHIYDFNPYEWNNIKITAVENDLHLYFNNRDVGIIHEFDDDNFKGGVRIDGGNGCMFKNIIFAENDDIIDYNDKYFEDSIIARYVYEE